MNKILYTICRVIMFLMGVIIGLVILDMVRWLIYNIFLEFKFSEEISYYSTAVIMIIIGVAGLLITWRKDINEKLRTYNRQNKI